ncbi:MAG: pyridoxamine 5'-phosphate oxidase family protein [Candidatus Rokubacteria bacterium]|nr:pyridoxamine 5'-phosphate oxidase family protein [Candidatus Rokubacteria bacterium]
MFKDVVVSKSELRALGGEPMGRAVLKEHAELDQHCRDFIARSPFVLIATAGANGRCDVSPKGDAPGFVHVLDAKHLAIPDRPGNKRFDGMTNLLENPHVGLIFLVPGREDTLRVNGRAWIVRDTELLEGMTVMGKRPQLAIGVEVEEAYMHCAKAFKRSGLWETGRWPDVAALPSPQRILYDHAGKTDVPFEEYERGSKERLISGLY